TSCAPSTSSDPARRTTDLSQWLADSMPTPVELKPETLFNIIYSSGTTGEPKGIVHDHLMRWSHIQRGIAFGYGADGVTLMSTPRSEEHTSELQSRENIVCR